MSLINPQPSLEGKDSVETSGSIQEKDWLNISREAYDSSTEYMDSNLRDQWEKNISNFNSRHPSGSKYLTSAYDKRSTLFRPKTRSTVRKLEAAMATAFFSNEDVVDISPTNPNDPMSISAATVAKSMMQYRLTNTIPWFSTMVTAMQDAAVYGTVVSHQYWEFEEKEETYSSIDETGAEVVDMEGKPVREKVTSTLKDKPIIEIIEPENFRIDPASDWYNPVESSPYVIHLIPMFVQDVLEKMDKGEWKKLKTEQILSASKEDDDSIRLTREEGRSDPLDDEFENIDEFKIVWVHKNIIKKDGEDYCFFTAGTDYMLTKPRLLSEVYPWLKDGERPYVMGKLNIEAHRLYPAGTVELTEELQAASNDIWNQRFDNIKLAMNKRYHIRRDRNIDLDALFRSVPGGAVEMDDPDADVRVVETRDVTGSAYQEQDRINYDFDELQGNFSTSTIQSSGTMNETVGGMSLLQGNNNIITEFVLRTLAESWVEPCLKQLLRLEQYYETDEIIMSLSSEENYEGKDQLIDDLLKHDVILKVNVGMNATDPIQRVQNLVYGLSSVFQLPGMETRINIDEVAKEIFGQLGYKDGARFLTQTEDEVDPEMQELQGQVQELQSMLEIDQVKMQGRLQIEQLKQQASLRAAQIKAQTDIAKQQMGMEKDAGSLAIKQNESIIKQQDADTRRAELMLQRDALINQIISQQSEPVDKDNVSKAGTMARDKYNKVPYAQG
tara:strand:- start:2193 stop:4370 length:2178 start_codon:yes stop_codon:yes gene_type:complete